MNISNDTMSENNFFEQGFNGKRWLSRAHLVDLANAAKVAITIREGEEGRSKMYKEAWAPLINHILDEIETVYKRNSPALDQDQDIIDEVFLGGPFSNNKRLRVQLSRAIRSNVFDIVTCLFSKIRDGKRVTGNGRVWLFKGELHSDLSSLVEMLGEKVDKEVTLKSGNTRVLRVEPIVEKMRNAVEKVKERTPELEPPPREPKEEEKPKQQGRKRSKYPPGKKNKDKYKPKGNKAKKKKQASKGPATSETQ